MYRRWAADSVGLAPYRMASLFHAVSRKNLVPLADRVAKAVDAAPRGLEFASSLKAPNT
jgi:hypothetical protein